MKIITLNESQFKRLFESDKAPDFSGGDLEEFPGAGEISTTTNVMNADGDLEYGEEPETDKFADEQSPQQWGSRYGRRGGWCV